MKTPVNLNELVTVLADAVIVTDRDGHIVLWNGAATRLFGHSESEALGQTLDLIVPERLRHRHNLGFHHSMQTGTTRYGDQLLKVPALHRDGHTLSIAFTVTMLLGDDQAVAGVAAVIRDDTARFLAERALKARIKALEQQQTPAVMPAGSS